MNSLSEAMMLAAFGDSRPNFGEHDAQIRAVAGDWLTCGFPQVVVGHKLAASLCATTISKESTRTVVSPWRTFLVLVPTGLLPGVAPGTSDPSPTDEVVGIFVTGDIVRRAIVFFSHDMFFAPLDSSTEEEEEQVLESVGRKLVPWGSEHVTPVIEMSIRLALGAMIELDSKEHRDRRQGQPPRYNPPRRGSPLPKAWTFQLARNVKVDVREAVRSYCVGAGKSPTVQILVRGHSKRQACGPGLADRKWITIEPYWRGPEDAPIAVRSHVL